ncbi:MAG: hypothetical protein FJ126_12015 [Deltaproteobacteria bacterium]|nr:hypothetical protein [Deltaproteobacteria bacterium]
MLTESAQDLLYTPEESNLLVAVFPHPLHGRLIEKVILMLVSRIEFMGQTYQLTWRDGGVAFYAPVLVGAKAPKALVRTRGLDLAFDPHDL